MYDYKEGKKRIESILKDNMEVLEKDKLPNDNELTFSNGYYSWVTAIFVDLRDSSKIFNKEDKEEVSKMIRSFTSEIIEILRKDDLLREIGIRGDCVYAIYTTPKQGDIDTIFTYACYVNTFLNMLNKLLEQNNFETINAGIGVATSQELVVKAGRKGVDINNKVWIGDAVTKASNLSSIGDKLFTPRMSISSCTYSNILEYIRNTLKNENYARNFESWFQSKYNDKYGYYYSGNVIMNEMNNWINEGMPDE